MNKPTKKQLRDKISELQNDLYRSIAGLPDGELRKKMASKYPDYYVMAYIDKYGTTNFIDEFYKIASSQPVNEIGNFMWFENAKS